MWVETDEVTYVTATRDGHWCEVVLRNGHMLEVLERAPRVVSYLFGEQVFTDVTLEQQAEFLDGDQKRADDARMAKDAEKRAAERAAERAAVPPCNEPKLGYR